MSELFTIDRGPVLFIHEYEADEGFEFGLVGIETRRVPVAPVGRLPKDLYLLVGQRFSIEIDRFGR